MEKSQPSVGVFWGVPGGRAGQLMPLVENVPLTAAERYGECLTFGSGHDEVWQIWRDRRDAPAVVRSNEYDEVPRGRVVFHQPTNVFWLYADRKLQGAGFISEVVFAFGLEGYNVELRSDGHYR